MEHTWSEVIELLKQYRDIKWEHWLHESLFSFSWWVLFITSVVALVVWLIILDKKRIFEIIMYGFFVTTIAVMADGLGISLLLWSYPTTLTPGPAIIEIHKIQMPIIYMLIYQYFTRWKPFFIASTINAFIFAFIFEPILVWLHIYETYHWEHIYSFLPYIAIAVVFKGLIHKFKQLDQHYL